jgi:hypothetical protein
LRYAGIVVDVLPLRPDHVAAVVESQVEHVVRLAAEPEIIDSPSPMIANYVDGATGPAAPADDNVTVAEGRFG